ncbi:helix-turn-helix domain-containing protein [Streptomyces sp. NPDC048172]|uniref:AraC family transcriptional regulator n=1 Tax=Streptomyces sp. NPDC048172 TaxID=3365505 RepID=UPI00371F45A7
MLSADRAWTLEQNDRRLTLFAEPRPYEVGLHRHPAWKLVLADAEAVTTGGRAVSGPGLLVPPQLAHTCRTRTGYAALFLDPWLLAGPTEITPLPAPAVRRLRAALPDLDSAYVELVALTGAVPAGLDPRVAHVLRYGALAEEVGLSPVRLRTLVRESVGIPLVRLRRWARLRDAVGALSSVPPARAATDAGFADQPHLTRTARTLLGRTPASFRAAR